MSTRETYENIFIDCFGVDREVLNEEFIYQCVPSWDSVGHMAMVAQIEDTFGIMLEMDDIIDFSSFTVGIATLKKYGVDVS